MTVRDEFMTGLQLGKGCPKGQQNALMIEANGRAIDEIKEINEKTRELIYRLFAVGLALAFLTGGDLLVKIVSIWPVK